ARSRCGGGLLYPSEPGLLPRVRLSLRQIVAAGSQCRSVPARLLRGFCSLRCGGARLLPSTPLPLPPVLISLHQTVGSGPQSQDAIAELLCGFCFLLRRVGAPGRCESVRLRIYEPLPLPLVLLSLRQTFLFGPQSRGGLAQLLRSFFFLLR